MLDKRTKCWILTEGLAGTENQCLGVAQELGVDFEVRRVNLLQPWKTLSPPLLKAFSGAFVPRLEPPWPDFLIASGRKSVPASVYIKKKSGGKCFTVQIQDPKVNPACFDLVAVPCHDDLRGPNVIVTDAAPNRVTKEELAKARQKTASLLSPLPAPRVAVLIGGKSKAYEMTGENTQKLITQLHMLIKEYGAGLMMTASRRTGEENEHRLRESLKSENVYFWDGAGDNPYMGFLAWADYILVTEDSVSMISEAAGTGKPVYRIPLTGGSRRLKKFHRHMEEISIVKEFRGALEKWTYPPLNDSRKIANAIRSSLDHTQSNQRTL